MPVFLRYSQYKIYFWSAENDEPIHFHVAQGDPGANDTKIWILRDGSMRIAHNKGRIPRQDLLRIMTVMESYVEPFEAVWLAHEGQLRHIDD